MLYYYPFLDRLVNLDFSTAKIIHFLQLSKKTGSIIRAHFEIITRCRKKNLELFLCIKKISYLCSGYDKTIQIKYYKT